MILFQNLLDIGAYNAYVIFIACNPAYNRGKSHRRRIFLESLGLDMVAEAVEARQPAAACVIQEVAPASGRHGAPAAAAGAKKRVRCGRCSRSADKKTVERCSACNTPICTGHVKASVQPHGATKTLPVMLNIPAMLLDYLADTLGEAKNHAEFRCIICFPQFISMLNISFLL